MAVDALQIADQVEMDRTGLDALGAAGPDALVVAFGSALFGQAQVGLFLQQLARHFHIARHEQVAGHLQVGGDAMVEVGQFGQAFLREGQLVLDLLLRQLHQVLVDDVADMLQVGGEGQHVDIAAAFGFIQPMLGQFGEIQFDRLIQAVHRIVGLFHGLGQLGIVTGEYRHGVIQHARHGIAEPQRFACRGRQRHRRGF